MRANDSPDSEALQRRIITVVDSVLSEEDLDWIQFDHRRSRVWVSLAARGETLSRFLLCSPHTDPDSQLELFATGLEDWVAESRFGWGQRRVVPPHLYLPEADGPRDG